MCFPLFTPKKSGKISSNPCLSPLITRNFPYPALAKQFKFFILIIRYVLIIRFLEDA